MSNLFFIAVQCCQCSTMQVKQRKKSSKSNKWTCVVCNQKQSIQKVFAQGPTAKDLRFFVQSFNMSRQSESQSRNRRSSPELSPPAVDPPGDSKRPRSDWTEFLDPCEESCDREAKHGGDFGPEIVTELPAGSFKKAKLNKYASGRLEAGDCGALYKHVFSKRNASKQVLSQEKEPLEPRNHDFAKAMCGSRESDKQREGDQNSRKGREASKWSDYITREDDDDAVQLVGAGKFTDGADDWSSDMLECLINEDKVEDEEIHPDFL